METKNKSYEMLKSFTAYCQANPEQRFWQALRNWTQENLDADCNFIYLAPADCLAWMMDGDDKSVVESLKDTFYIEDDAIRPPRD